MEYAALVDWLSQPKHAWLITVFGVYVALILVFSTVYYGLYITGGSHFIFHSEVRSRRLDLIERRLQNSKEAREVRVAGLVGRIELLESVLREIANGVARMDKTDYWSCETALSTDDYVVKRHIQLGDLHTDDIGFLTIFRPDGKTKLCDFHASFRGLPQSVDESRLLIEDLLQSLKQELEQRLAPVKTWSYSDFLYFSTITQTTVGYGDILPNSKAVRILVMLQALIGLALFVVVINLSIGVFSISS